MRMRWPERALAVGVAVALSGCATSSLDLAPPTPDRPWVPQVDAHGEIVAGAPAGTASAATGFVLPANHALTVPPAETVALDPGRRYTLAQLIDLAESSNPSTRIAWNEARRAALAAGIAESTYLPQLTASALAGRQHGVGHDTLAGTSFERSDTVHGSVSVLSLKWLLFDFGERAAVVEAAQQGAVVANIAFTAAHQQVIHAVCSAFYAHAAAVARVRTATQALANAHEVETAAQARYRRGIGTVVEAAQARQATAAAELAKVQADGERDDTYLALLTAVGLPPTSHLAVTDLSDRPLPHRLDGTLDARIEAALARRPDMLAAWAAQKAGQAQVRAARAEFKPKLFLSATGAYTRGGLDISAVPAAGEQPPAVNVGGHHYSSALFLGVTVPLYDGGLRSATLARAQAQADSAEATLERTRDDAVRQIVAADNGLRTALAAHDAAQALVQAAQTTFDAALGAYRHGVGSITDVTVAESQLLLARNAQSDAHSAALTAAATLALATGELGVAPP